ncbi:PadR family transcriptional regulator [Gloeocapsopsis dulcis]|uniref:PadR family transcriptional regulator n=1 Tax=Gloeocapsopsis dulcis AAB1 = 1H9 TaxID=1433147 RepID=A0A6N8FRU5_9CHRO|nr:PadR family transcriptional regulator [Gloeocapsopsis dulcis]MUL35055.1 PadR family transcriptional regulator [Gloeocapsopsis dulcis AAB1 = 1H9]WNN89867.1 PadR family transcriptional regulator [Gloeocapsopsis dulcis]
MARENKSKYAIMGILTWGSMSGYDIKKEIEQSVNYFWHESYGQIYPILKRLVAEGLATKSVEEQAGKPDRYVYTLTERGKEELRQWLTQPADNPVERIEILLKLIFGRHVSVADNIQHVKQFQEFQQQLLQEYRSIEQKLQHQYCNEPDYPYCMATLRYGFHTSQALLNWCDETLAMLHKIAESTQN